MIEGYGFECEIHEYTTEDGYINVLHRILPKPIGNEKIRNQTVFLQHGLMGTSADYVMGAPNSSLGKMRVSYNCIQMSNMFNIFRIHFGKSWIRCLAGQRQGKPVLQKACQPHRPR